MIRAIEQRCCEDDAVSMKVDDNDGEEQDRRSHEVVYGWRDVRGSISETRLAIFKFGCDLKHCTPPSHINKGSNHDENSVIQVPSHNIGLECLEICWE